jgi:hypothetical protein
MNWLVSSWVKTSWVKAKIVTTYKDEFKGNQTIVSPQMDSML